VAHLQNTGGDTYSTLVRYSSRVVNYYCYYYYYYYYYYHYYYY